MATKQIITLIQGEKILCELVFDVGETDNPNLLGNMDRIVSVKTRFEEA